MLGTSCCQALIIQAEKKVYYEVENNHQIGSKAINISGIYFKGAEFDPVDKVIKACSYWYKNVVLKPISC